jgi:hypothetical protein
VLHVVTLTWKALPFKVRHTPDFQNAAERVLNGAETLLLRHGSTKNHVPDARKVSNDSNQPRKFLA